MSGADDLAGRAAGLASRIGALTQAAALERRHLEELERELAACAHRLELREPVEAFVAALSRRLHESLLGDFERLLTAMFHDVFPEYAESRAIGLALSVSRRSGPELDIHVLRNGEPEPITGGGVLNVISTGLRYIALIRSRLYPFIVLDESDCWLQSSGEERVGRFVGVIDQVSRDLGIQTLMITHHDRRLFEDFGAFHVIALARDGDRIDYDVDGVPAWPDGARGVRRIVLENVLAHRFANLPLAPGVNLITGPNDVGKSCIVAALRALFYGEAGRRPDRLLHHGAQTAGIAVDLGPDGRLSWKTRRQGRRGCVSVWRLETPDEEILRESEQTPAPEWLDTLGFGRPEGFEIQLAGQRSPVFLLDQPAPARARVLAIGTEANYLKRMEEIWREWVRRDQTTLREGERRLARLKAVVAALAKTDDWPQSFRPVLENVQALRDRLEDAARLRKTIDDLEAAARRAIAPVAGAAPDFEATADRMASAAALSRLIAEMESARRRASLPPVTDSWQPPALQDTDDLRRTVAELERLEARTRKVSVIGALKVSWPDLERQAALARMVDSLSTAAANLALRQRKRAELEDYGVRLHERWRDFVKKIGGVCPVCGQLLDLNGIDKHAAGEGHV